MFLCVRPSTLRWYDAGPRHYQWSALNRLVCTSEKSFFFFCISEIKGSFSDQHASHHPHFNSTGCLLLLLPCSATLAWLLSLILFPLDVVARMRNLSPVGSTCGTLRHHNYSSIMITIDKTHEANKLKRRNQTICSMTYSRRAFTHQYTKGFRSNICMAISLHMARLQ